MHIDFPLHVDSSGRTATTRHAEHVRDMIEQLLFTAPGSRPNRPEFGCGLLEMVFDGGQDLQVAAHVLVKGSLQRWLGEVIEIQDVSVTLDAGKLAVHVRYRLRSDGTEQAGEFSHEL